jgi:hypothetical protein
LSWLGKVILVIEKYIRLVICSEIIVSQFYLLRSNASSVVDVVPSKFTVYVYVQTLVRLVLKRRKKINPFQFVIGFLVQEDLQNAFG